VRSDLRRRRPPLRQLGDQVDAPARGVHLLTPQGVRGARRQAESTVDTRVGQCAQVLHTIRFHPLRFRPPGVPGQGSGADRTGP
jgi:hypothetical protein